MLTNVLLITLLVLLISNIVLAVKLFLKTENLLYFNADKIKTNYRTIIEVKEMVYGLRDNQNIRIQEQEKLISELKRTQAPKSVIDTIDIVDEWLNGKPE